MLPNVNPLNVPESRQEGEVTKFLTLRFVDANGLTHEYLVRAYAGCEVGDEELDDTWDWAANTRDDMAKMNLGQVWDTHLNEEVEDALMIEKGLRTDLRKVHEVDVELGAAATEVMSALRKLARTIDAAASCYERRRDPLMLTVQQAKEKSGAETIPAEQVAEATALGKKESLLLAANRQVGPRGLEVVNPYAAVVLVAHAGHVLMCRFSSEGSADGMLPGGKLEPGESAQSAAIREFGEETGLRLSSFDAVPLAVAQTHDGKPMMVFRGNTFLLDFPLEDRRYVEPEGYVRWVPYADVLNNYYPVLRDAAEKIFENPAVREYLNK